MLQFLAFMLALLPGSIIAQLGSTLSTRYAVPCSPSLSFAPSPDTFLRPNYPTLVEIQVNAFNELLEDTSGFFALALEIKKSQIATADLAMLVRMSKLTIKDALMDTLIRFGEEAKVTNTNLLKLKSKVDGAVDTIVAINHYALRHIATAPKPSKYSLQALLKGSQASETNKLLLSSFKTSVKTTMCRLNSLMVDAQTSLASLDKLEWWLFSFQALVLIEDKGLAGGRDEMLGSLWARLRGNMVTMDEASLNVLNELGEHHKKARTHLVRIIKTLKSMNANIEDLREWAGAPEWTGDHIPVEVQMQSIQVGLERLKEGKGTAQEVEEAAKSIIFAG